VGCPSPPPPATSPASPRSPHSPKTLQVPGAGLVGGPSVSFKLGGQRDAAGAEWMDLSSFCTEGHEGAVTYLNASLRLLWHLCLGGRPPVRSGSPLPRVSLPGHLCPWWAHENLRAVDSTAPGVGPDNRHCRALIQPLISRDMILAAIGAPPQLISALGVSCLGYLGQASF